MALARLSDNLSPSVPSFLNNFFEGDWMDWTNSNFSAENTSLPKVNIRENNDEYIIEVAAPGMKKDDFKINYDNGRLTISSEIKEEAKEDGEYTRREFCYQSFQRSFSISKDQIDGEKIQAGYTDGILHILLPKREEVKPKPAREIAVA